MDSEETSAGILTDFESLESASLCSVILRLVRFF